MRCRSASWQGEKRREEKVSDATPMNAVRFSHMCQIKTTERCEATEWNLTLGLVGVFYIWVAL